MRKQRTLSDCEMRGLQSQMLIWIIMLSTIVQHYTVHQNEVPSPKDSQQGMNEPATLAHMPAP